MRTRTCSAPRTSREHGAALVVGLLLLLVLTLLAISGMNTASLELVMAGNTQYHQNAFQAAETGIERALVDDTFNPVLATAEETLNVAIAGSSIDKYSTWTRRQLDGKAQPAMWGSSWNSFSTYHFEIESHGESARNATARNFQGVAIISPADATVPPLGPPATTELE
ncbi:MAG TPA: PilX N-terminal domain-containing pilus assembly protein [Steroidobacter sp.]|jgi:type IV pilus assembly protein PilX|nr:PilX N-terminal domain-containing pilus assembly protein [Steroidobacteraceae bacterium]HLS80494.1 PilX N-terminal domain-containing pilus assembly protein [Steroidobacter sp.]